MEEIHNGPLGEGFTVLGLMQVCLRRAVAPKCRSTGFGVMCNKEPVFRLATLSRCLCTYAEEQGMVMVTASSFVPGEAMPPCPDVLQEGGTVSLVHPKGSLDHTLCSRASALFLHRSTVMPSGLHAEHHMDL